MTLNTGTATPQNSPIDFDGVHLTNAQRHMAPISILNIKNPELYYSALLST